jgi:hypothetical protein
MTFDDGATVLPPGEGKTVSFSGTFSGNRITFVYGEPDTAYSIVKWAAAPSAPGTPLHIHRATDEAFYVLEGTFGFQVGDRTLEVPVGTFVFVPRGCYELDQERLRYAENGRLCETEPTRESAFQCGFYPSS